MKNSTHATVAYGVARGTKDALIAASYYIMELNDKEATALYDEACEAVRKLAKRLGDFVVFSD